MAKRLVTSETMPTEGRFLAVGIGDNGMICQHLRYENGQLKFADNCFMPPRQCFDFSSGWVFITSIDVDAKPKTGIKDLLRSASASLRFYIDRENKALESGISCTDLDSPDYHDYELCHDLDVVAASIEGD